MAEHSNIEWTDATWNPSTGCNAVSPGCEHCYAETLSLRWQKAHEAKVRDLEMVYYGELDSSRRTDESVEAAHNKLEKLQDTGRYRNGFKYTEHEGALLEPLRMKKGRRIFTCSMSDLFHERATAAHLDRVFAVMAACPQHIFMVLTKRPHRMCDYLAGLYGTTGEARREVAMRWLFAQDTPGMPAGWATAFGVATGWAADAMKPLPNVWLGTTVENQPVTQPGWYPGYPDVPGRIDSLLECPAALRFLSCEPLLGPLDLGRWIPPQNPFWRALGGALPAPIHWIITGGESGKGARPAHPDWFRSLRDQCAAAGVTFFFKQWGEWAPAQDAGLCFDDSSRYDVRCMRPSGDYCDAALTDGTWLYRVGKKRAGHLLDGVTHQNWPEVNHG